jgi:preprotein translocase subunit SecY
MCSFLIFFKKHMMSKIKFIFQEKSIRNRILFVLFAFFLFRFLSNIPIPGVDAERLSSFLGQQAQLAGILNILSAGGITTLSLVMLGVGPYITASIIMQLTTVLYPKMKAMYQEEGEMGRRKFNQYSRMLALPLSLIQGYGLLVVLQRQGILETLNTSTLLVNLVVIVASSYLLMWIAELITERGIGNGISLIIFAGIVAVLPTTFGQTIATFTQAEIPNLFLIAVSLIVVIAGVIFITEAERPVPVTYAKQSRGFGNTSGGASTYLPLRLNQAGVVPIIFALSLFTFPQIMASFMENSANPVFQQIASGITWFFNNAYLYTATYFILVFGFTYLYTAIIFDPKQISDNLQKSGAFIPGIRPGNQTAEYLGEVTGRITLVGALFLGLVAILPVIMQHITGNTALTVGGTSLLIVVSVVLDVLKKVNAQASMREY